MYRMEKIIFARGVMKVFLTNQRILLVPLLKFPEIKKLSSQQKSKYHIAGGISLDFEDSD